MRADDNFSRLLADENNVQQEMYLGLSDMSRKT